MKTYWFNTKLVLCGLSRSALLIFPWVLNFVFEKLEIFQVADLSLFLVIRAHSLETYL